VPPGGLLSKVGLWQFYVFLSAYNDVAFSILTLAIFSAFGNTSYVSEIGEFNGDGSQHLISDT